ncbi:MAG: PKD domain-containing protein [Bacteroidetes bacterium]|nr:PKD domain-containing protein [Bacteroidota bacterium]
MLSLTNKVKKSSRKDFEWRIDGSTRHDSAWYNGVGNLDFTLAYAYKNATCQNTATCPQCIMVRGPKAGFESKTNVRCNPGDSMFIINSTQLFGAGPVKYKWLIDDTTGKNYISIGPTATSDINLVFPKPGVWNLQLVASGSTGCIDTFREKKYLIVSKPQALFKADTNSVCLGKNILLKNLTLPVEELNNPYKYLWVIQHSDSVKTLATFTQRTVDYNPPKPGEYNVFLVVKSLKGCNDTFIKNRYLKINGEVPEILTNKVTGCPPISIIASSRLKMRYPDTSSNIPKYTWSISPKKGDSMTRLNDTAYNIDFTAPGCYNVSLNIKDSNQCKSVISKSICVGSNAVFGHERPTCLGVPVNINCGSDPVPNKYKWSVTPATYAYFLPNDSAAVLTCTFLKDTSYTITLNTTNTTAGVTCYGKKDSTFAVKGIRPAFTVSQTSAFCAPAIITFTNTSKRCNKFTWDWGDGTTTTTDTQKLVSHLYIKNNPAGYQVTIHIYDTLRLCAMLYNYPTLIKIVGPAPKFLLSKEVGCDSFNVSFTDSSKSVKSYIFNYDDGSAQLKNKMDDHWYKMNNVSADSQYFYPVMVAVDAKNCKNFQEDTVRIYRTPKAKMYAAPLAGCSPLKVSFMDSTKHAVKHLWDMDNDGSIDDSATNPNFAFAKAGYHSVRLIAEGKGGCRDTLIQNKLIKVWQSPLVDFRVSDTVICAYQQIKFTNLSTSAEDSIATYLWRFDEPKVKDTSVAVNPDFTYYTQGHRQVALTATDRRGCTTKSTKPLVRVKDSIPSSTAQLCYVSVNDSNSISIKWNKVPKAGFTFYTLTRMDSNFNNLFSTYNRADTAFTDLTAFSTNTHAYCYHIASADECNYANPTLKKHCSMQLTATAINGTTAQLNWSPYIGWDSLLTYALYRQEAGQKEALITTLTAVHNQWIDSNLCDKKYTYFVVAKSMSGGYSSYSNKVVFAPNYQKQNTPLAIYFATVNTKYNIGISWQKTPLSNLQKYILTKREAGGNATPEVIESNDTFYNDITANTSSKSYLYTVQALDKCGYRNPISATAQSILLTTTISDDKFILSWNKYHGWQSGVHHYAVQLIKKDKTVILLQHNINDTTYTLDSALSATGEPLCFRIMAYQNGGRGDSAASNISCGLLPSRLYLPNAFTPDNNGLNDVWKPSSLFISSQTGGEAYQYSLRIFNRWGEMVFETHDLDQGWDGLFNGAKAPTDAYTYILKATGIDNHSFYKTGSISLLRK